MAIGVCFSILFAFLLIASPAFHVRCQSDTETDAAEVGDLGVVGDDAQDFGEMQLSSAAGVYTMCVFPQNSARLVTAGKETELLIGISNEGESTMKVVNLRASLHFSFDHEMIVQNLTLQEFYNSTVPVSAQATFPYIFAVSKYLQPGSFDLVGKVFYEIDQHPYQSVFYNGTIEVVEDGGFLSIESVFLVTLGVALLGLLGLWVYGQIQNLSKKKKRVPKVEMGTATAEADLDEWLKGTAYTQSSARRPKKK